MAEAVSAKPLLRLICQRQISFLSKTNIISLRPQNFHQSRLSHTTKFQLSKPSNKSFEISGFGFSLKPINNRNLQFSSSNAHNVEEGGEMKSVLCRGARGESTTMPLKEAPDHPVWGSWLIGIFNLSKEALDHRVWWWPWLIPLAFGIYAWRMVLWEPSNPKKGFLAIGRFMGYRLKLAMAFVIYAWRTVLWEPSNRKKGFLAIGQFLGYLLKPAVAVDNCIGTAILPCLCRYVGAVLVLIVNFLFLSILIYIAHTAVPGSVRSQPYLLTLSGIVGIAAVTDFIPELVFWRLMMGLFCFSRLFKKRDLITSLFPVAAALSVVGQLWLRLVVIASYYALAKSHDSKKLSEGNSYIEAASEVRELPALLLVAGLAIGIHVAAKWIRYRHLTWLIV